MKVRPEQLTANLKQRLAPVYLVHGDEALLVAEASDAIRGFVREQGFDERNVFTVDPGFDWNVLREAGASMSLFAQKRLIELRLPSGKPQDAGSKALLEYLGYEQSDSILLIVSGKIDARSQQSKWFKALDQRGVTVQIWPVKPQQLPGWINQRMKAVELQPTRDAVALLAERVEGNLLACVQEIEKLRLLNGAGKIDADAVRDSVVDSARYDIYGLVDAALGGDVGRTTHIVNGLRAEEVEIVLALWALTREIRELARMAAAQKNGENLEQIFRKHRVWETRKPLIKRALARHNVNVWQQLLCQAGRVDRTIKGVVAGDAWEELLQLAVKTALSES
ncbi:MAG TPA: DNA polymerase III subunit delta [Gammaproteobacteria bacterium]|nr:DNA polymerase III subunit delta [Gammaproteobacteria bacterium]